MNLEEAIITEIKTLPKDQQQEVLDFTLFLKLKQNQYPQRSSLFGSDKNIISLRDDFNQSLEDIIKQSDEQDKLLTPQERTEKWLDFVQTLPQQSTNLPDEALYRSMIRFLSPSV
jgi:hypothetical protein